MNSIIKDKNGYRIDSYTGIGNLSQQAKENLIQHIKIFTGFEYGFVNALNEIIQMPSLQSLMKLKNTDTLNSIKLLVM